MDFVAVNPEKITRGASSIEILIGNSVGRVHDVINDVQRQVHGLFLLAFDVSIISYTL